MNSKKKRKKKEKGGGKHTHKTQNRTKYNTKIIIISQIMTIPKSTTNIQIHHFKTTFMCPRSIVGVPSDRALPGFPITAHHLCAFLLYLEGCCVAA